MKTIPQHTATGQLSPVAPFDFAKSLAFLGEFMPTRHEQTVSENSLVKLVYAPESAR